MKAAFFDIDGTLVSDFSGISFINFLSEKGKFRKDCRDRLVDVTQKYKSGKVSYEKFAQVIGDEISRGLKNQKQSEVYGLANEFWDKIKPKFAYWAKDLIALLNNRGFDTIAISGSPIELLNLYKEKFNFKNVFASTAEVIDDIYTGGIIINLVLRDKKEKIVRQIIMNNNVNLKNSFGFGDNEHDRAFLDKVGHPVAISSESSLKDYAKKHGWPVFKFTDNVFEEVKKILENQEVR